MTKKRPRISQAQPSKSLWIWGKHACLAALDNPRRKCSRLIISPAMERELARQSYPCKKEVIEGNLFSQLLSEGAVHQGIALEVSSLPECPMNEVYSKNKGVLIALDHVTDPQNVGAIIRVARALGALGIIMTDRHAPVLGGVVAKTASGALESLPIWRVSNLARTLDELKEEGFWSVGLDERARETISQIDIPAKIIMVMGAEGEGLRRLTQEKCDFLTKLPTDPKFSTLNVSVATGLALYELSRKVGLI